MFTKKENYIVEKNALLDGRILALFTKKILKGNLYLPEIKEKKIEEILEKLSNCKGLKIHKRKELEDTKALIKFGEKKKATIFKIQETFLDAPQGTVNVIDVDELFSLLAPKYKPGTETIIKIVKKGKEEQEGIGYLKNGIKVVIENGGKYINKYVEIVIKGIASTPNGQIAFAKLKYTE